MSPTISGGPAHDQRSPRCLQTVTEYSLRGFLTVEETLFRGFTDQGFEAWPTKGSTGIPDRQSQGLHGRVVQATLECGVQDVLRSVQGQSRVPSREIPSREPSDPIEWVRAPPSEPLRALYVMCPWTTSQPLSNGAR